MRILLFCALYPTKKHPRVVGGAEILIKRLAEGLASRGEEVFVIRSGAAWERETENGVQVFTVSAFNLYRPFTGSRGAVVSALWHVLDDWGTNADAISTIMKVIAPDVIHTNTLSGLTAGTWKLAADRSIPIVHTLHDYYLLCPRCTMYLGGKNCESICKKCILTTMRRRQLSIRVNAVIGVSQRILDIHLSSGVFNNASLKRIIHNFSDPQPCEILHQPTNPIKVGFIGRLSEEKGIYLLAKAMNKVPPNLACLVVAGTGSTEVREEMRRLAPNTDVTFLGFVEQSEFYRAVDIVVATSLWEEPGALIVGEALSFGRPVVAGTRGGTMELVLNGENGWIVPLEVDSLASLITEVASNLPGLQAVQKTTWARSKRSNFGMLIEKYLTVYREVC